MDQQAWNYSGLICDRKPTFAGKATLGTEAGGGRLSRGAILIQTDAAASGVIGGGGATLLKDTANAGNEVFEREGSNMTFASDGGAAGSSAPGLNTTSGKELVQAGTLAAGKTAEVNEASGREPETSAVDEHGGVRFSTGEDKIGNHGATVRIKASAKDAAHLAEIRTLQNRVAELKVEHERSEAEKSAALSELGIVRNGLGELLEKLQENERRSVGLQSGFAAMLDSSGADGSAVTAARLLQRWQSLAVQGQELEKSIARYCSEIDSLIGDLPLTEMQRAELQLAADNLKNELRKFNVATKAGDGVDKLDKTRIYAVNPDLGVVVLPVGIDHGTFNGLTLYGAGENPVEVRIVSVRARVSAAVLINGNITGVAPGTVLHVDVNKLKD